MFFFMAICETFKTQEFDLGDYLAENKKKKKEKNYPMLQEWADREKETLSRFSFLLFVHGKLCVLHKKSIL